MHLLDQCEQLFPGFAVGAAIPAGIDGREFPPLAAGEDGDGLLECWCERLQSAWGCGRAILPKLGSEFVLRLFQARFLNQEVLEIRWHRQFVKRWQTAG